RSSSPRRDSAVVPADRRTGDGRRAGRAQVSRLAPILRGLSEALAVEDHLPCRPCHRTLLERPIAVLGIQFGLFRTGSQRVMALGGYPPTSSARRPEPWASITSWARS